VAQDISSYSHLLTHTLLLTVNFQTFEPKFQHFYTATKPTRQIYEYIKNIQLFQGTIVNLMIKLNATMRRDCDDIHALGYRTDGVYGIFAIYAVTGFVDGFCEIEKEGFNWLVNGSTLKQSVC